MTTEFTRCKCSRTSRLGPFTRPTLPIGVLLTDAGDCLERNLSDLAWQTKIAKQMNWHGRFVILPRDETPKHLLLPGNTAQHIVVSSGRIRTELGYEEPVCIEEASLHGWD
jgi:hypothetical protein